MKVSSFFIIFFIFNYSWFFSQDIRIVYEAKKITDKDTIVNYYNLDIIGKKSYFYESNMFGSDSLHLSSNMIIEKNYENNTIVCYDKFDEVFFKYIEKNKALQNLKINSKKKSEFKITELAKYNDLWKITFSTKDNLIDGPYKFYGLPGLVYNIENKNKTFLINLIEIKKLKSPTNFNFIVSAKEISKEKFLQTQKSANEVLLNNLANMPFSKEDLKKMKDMIQSSNSKNLFLGFE